MANVADAPGAWSAYAVVSDEARAVFKQAINGLVGVTYTPVAFASQVVAGLNYSFLCNAAGVYPGGVNQAAIIDIYQAPNGIPKITEVRIFKP